VRTSARETASSPTCRLKAVTKMSKQEDTLRVCAHLAVMQASGLDLGDGALQCCGLPSMVTNTHALDVIQVRDHGFFIASSSSSSSASSSSGSSAACACSSCSCATPVLSVVGVLIPEAKGDWRALPVTAALCAVQVAVGARHAALTTRGGEVYTWGAGAGGNMGNGTSAGSNYPQQVRHDSPQGVWGGSGE
jgi:hypothetical protein